MPSVDAIARRLHRRRDPDGRKWKLGWRVVRKVYTADNPAILGSSERGASFTLSGSADALKQLEVGNASADISISSTQADTIEILGGHGPIALDLFKVRVTGRAGLVSFAPGEAGDDEGKEDGEPELDADWADDLDDDPDDLFE